MSQNMSKSKCFAICACLSGKAPACPYFGLPCLNFYVNFGRGVCCDDGVRCSWEPSWVPNVGLFRYAILKKDGKLHV